jgi:hypothetical protein
LRSQRVGTENSGPLGCYSQQMGYLFPTFRNYSSPSSSKVEQVWKPHPLLMKLLSLTIQNALMYSKRLFAKLMYVKL